MYQHNYLKLSSERRHVRLSCIMTVISNCLQNKDMLGCNLSRVISDCLQKEDMYVSTQLSQIVFRKKTCMYQHSYLKLSSERRHVCINTVISNCLQKEDMCTNTVISNCLQKEDVLSWIFYCCDLSTQLSQNVIRRKTCMYQHSSLKLPSERRHVCIDTVISNCHRKEDMSGCTSFTSCLDVSSCLLQLLICLQNKPLCHGLGVVLVIIMQQHFCRAVSIA